MLLTLYSWDGHLINDGTNYKAWFPRGSKPMPSAFPVWAPRAQSFPQLASKTINGGMVTFMIECKGTFHSQAETLRQWFAVDDYTPRVLICKDSADSDRQWYVTGFPTEPVLEQEGGISVYSVTLAVQEPFWRTVNSQSVEWLITASGQTQAVTPLGNKSARPVFSITPTLSKVGGYAYSKWLPWYNTNENANHEPLELTNGGLDTAALIADNSNKCQVNQGGGINASVTTIPYDTVTGTVPDSGMIYCGTEQMSYTGKTGTTSGNLTGVTRGVNGTTAAVHADNAVIYVSKMKANGDDLRVIVDGVEVDRWLSGINTSATKIWINQISQRGISLRLNTAIASSGDVTTLTVIGERAGYFPPRYYFSVIDRLASLPSTFLFAIGTEIFVGSDANPLTYSFNVTRRATRNSTMAAHAVGDTINWIEHDIYLVYGNPNADAPDTDDTRKPILNLSSSTNTSWVYDEFAALSGPRSGSWQRSGERSGVKLSETYGGSHGAQADPATEAGLALKAYPLSGVWTADTALLTWSVSHPAQITHVTATGGKYRYTTEWPTVTMKDQRGIVLWTESSPAAAQTWASLDSHVSVATTLASGRYPTTILFELSGTISGSANNSALVELQSVTLTLSSTGVMQFLSAFIAGNNFQLESKIENTTTGEYFSFNLPVELNKSLVIDCDQETVTYEGTSLGVPLLFSSVRGPWLDLNAGSSNTLTFTDTGSTPGVTIDISWKDRNTL